MKTYMLMLASFFIFCSSRGQRILTMCFQNDTHDTTTFPARDRWYRLAPGERTPYMDIDLEKVQRELKARSNNNPYAGIEDPTNGITYVDLSGNTPVVIYDHARKILLMKKPGKKYIMHYRLKGEFKESDVLIN